MPIVFQVTARLLRAGIKLRYVATTGPLGPDVAALREHVRRVTGIEAGLDDVDFVDASTRGAALDVGAGDVPVATWWRTAQMANACLHHVRAREFLQKIEQRRRGLANRRFVVRCSARVRTHRSL